LKIPAAIARSLQMYIKVGGRESKKARIMLMAMGWLEDGNKASPEQISMATREWAGAEQEQIPF